MIETGGLPSILAVSAVDSPERRGIGPNLLQRVSAVLLSEGRCAGFTITDFDLDLMLTASTRACDEATNQASFGLIYSRHPPYDIDGGQYKVRSGKSF